MNILKRQKGLTLNEIVIALAIAALIGLVMASTIFYLQFYPLRSGADIQAQQDLKLAAQWITMDANRAGGFSSLTPPNYGVFSWTEYGDASAVSVKVTYLYDETTTSLMRKVEKDGALVHQHTVARNIARFEDVTLEYTAPAWELIPASGLYQFRPGKLTVNLTSTVPKVDRLDAKLTTTLVAELRGQFERTVPAPEP